MAPLPRPQQQVFDAVDGWASPPEPLAAEEAAHLARALLWWWQHWGLCWAMRGHQWRDMTGPGRWAGSMVSLSSSSPVLRLSMRFRLVVCAVFVVSWSHQRAQLLQKPVKPALLEGRQTVSAAVGLCPNAPWSSGMANYPVLAASRRPPPTSCRSDGGRNVGCRML